MTNKLILKSLRDERTGCNLKVEISNGKQVHTIRGYNMEFSQGDYLKFNKGYYLLNEIDSSNDEKYFELISTEVAFRHDVSGYPSSVTVI